MIKNRKDLKQLREFGLLIGITFPVLLGWIIPKVYGHPFANWTLFIGIPLLIIGILNPSLLSRPYKLWISLGYSLGWINSHLILGLVFILILQPIAYIMKFSGYDPLRIKRKNKQSYRENINDRVIDLNKIF